jgi:aminopeptidase YwaD
MPNNLLHNAEHHLSYFCKTLGARCVGSSNNLVASKYFKQILENYDWETSCEKFSAFDWKDLGTILKIGDKEIPVKTSPYSASCHINSSVVTASNTAELETAETASKILIVKDELVKEQLMPKNFVFYNPEEHRKLVSLLENSKAAAIVFAVNKNSNYEGGEFPFPVIEDGDFLIPSAFMDETDLPKLQTNNLKAELNIKTQKNKSCGYNVIGMKGKNNQPRITLTAHIDTKNNTPGALDNATGITILLLVAQLLQSYKGKKQIELVALNGEDYYSVPGQMTYIKNHCHSFPEILYNINIDGAGLKESDSAFSFFELEPNREINLKKIIEKHEGTLIGEPWYQGDHSIFLQYQVPAVAVTSQWLIENLQTQKITHTPKDELNIVAVDKLVKITEIIVEMIKNS